MARKILFEIEIENVGAARRIEALREEIRRLNKELKGADAGQRCFQRTDCQNRRRETRNGGIKRAAKATEPRISGGKVSERQFTGIAD